MATGDIFVLVRYELPFSIADGVSDAWCAYLEDETGCDGSPAVPEAPDTLEPQTVSITFYEDCIGTNCSAASILQYADQLPRLDHALAGAYFAPGHDLTWNTAAYGVCIESNAVTFTTANEQECLNPVWSTAASDTDTQRSELGERLLTELRTLETNRADPPLSIVNGNNLITENGRIFSIEALGVMPSIIGEFFQAATRVIATPFATVTGNGALQNSLDAANSDFVSDWDAIGSHYVGQPGRNVTTTITLLLAFTAAGLVGLLTTSSALGPSSGIGSGSAAGAVAFMLVLTIGAIGSGVPVDGFFAWIFFSSLPMAWWIVGKIRGG